MKITIAIVGILLFIYSLVLGSNLRKSEAAAVARDHTSSAFAFMGEDAPPSCLWQVHTPERVMAENKSQSIVVETKNTAKKSCETYLSLRAPSFDMSPARDEQKVVLPPGEKGSLSWILTPRKTGVYDLSVSDILHTKIFGITVTNVFGLSAAQAKIFSMLGTLLGPMLTVPWWVDKWIVRKKKQESPKPAV